MPHPEWSLTLTGRPRTFALAREASLVLVAKEDRLTLVDPAGRMAQRTTLDNPPTAIAAADDGSAFAVGLAGPNGTGRVVWYDATLKPVAAIARSSGITALAFDSHGQLLAVADQRANLRWYHADGQEVRRCISPRPLIHLGFVSAMPMVIGAADFGFVGGFDLRTDRWVWRDMPLNHVGGISAAGDGSAFLAAGFRAGVQRYSRVGKKEGKPEALPASRSVATSYDGRRTVLLGLDGALVGVSPDAATLFRWPHPAGAVVGFGVSLLGDRVWELLATGELSCRRFAERD